MNSILVVILSIMSLLNMSQEEHDIHLSMIEFSMEDDDTIEMSVMIFLDDLMNAVGIVPGEELPETYSSADELLQQFIEDHVSIKINNVVVQPMYKENFSSTPAVTLYYDIMDLPNTIESISIENTILLDLFEDQLNMVHFYLFDKTTAHSLDSDNTQLQVSF